MILSRLDANTRDADLKGDIFNIFKHVSIHIHYVLPCIKTRDGRLFLRMVQLMASYSSTRSLLSACAKKRGLGAARPDELPFFLAVAKNSRIHKFSMKGVKTLRFPMPNYSSHR